LKVNYIGIVAGILAFIGIALPWWSISVSAMGISTGYDVYLYQVATIPGATWDTWFIWAALALVIVGGLITIVASVMAKGKMILIGGGVLILLSLIIFAVGLMNALSGIPISGIGVFSSGSFSVGTETISWSTYLSYGFWLALVAMILAFVAYIRHPKEAAAPPAPA
jgi:hypothetical protein